MAKDRMMAQEDQGWSYSDKFVCKSCVNDEYLSRAIADEATNDEACDFCAAVPAASVDVLLAAFMDGVRLEYNDADAETVPWDGREGGYQAPTLDSWDLFGEYWDIFESEDLADEVRDRMAEQTWVERDWVWRRRDTVLRDAWAEFSDAVKYRTRYVVWIVENEDDEREARFAGEVPIGKILYDIGDLLQELDLVRELAAGTSLWRAQTHNTKELKPDASASRLGTSPREFAKQPNRMNPAGIPMFYGAMNETTALAEVERHNVDGSRYATLGKFSLTAPISVVDFTRLPDVPSVFHPQFGRLRREIAFLHEFVDALSRPVLQGDEGIDYVPTQIMTEFFLRILKPANGRSITGLVYFSAVDPGGKSNVLDIPHERCIDAGERERAGGPNLALRRSSVRRRRLRHWPRERHRPSIGSGLAAVLKFSGYATLALAIGKAIVRTLDRRPTKRNR